MKKWMGIISIACLVGMLAVLPSAFASSGPDTIDLHNGKKAVKGFPHKQHAEHSVKGKQSLAKFKYTDDYTCGACHHKSHKGETPKKCVSCKSEMLERFSGKLKKVMHKNCKDGCHKKTDKELIRCKTCHG